MSLYFPEHDAIFIHIPRTGGTWFKETCKKLGFKYALNSHTTSQRLSGYHSRFKHSPLCQYKPEFLAKIRFSFTFIRHPLDYYASVWKWMMSEPLEYLEKWGRAFPWNIPFNQFDRRFNFWVNNMLDHEPCWVTRLYETYCGPRGLKYLSHVGKTEDLFHSLSTIFKKVGFDHDRSLLRDLCEHKVNDRKANVDWDRGLKRAVLNAERVIIQRYYASTKEKDDRRRVRR